MTDGLDHTTPTEELGRMRESMIRYCIERLGDSREEAEQTAAMVVEAILNTRRGRCAVCGRDN